MSIRLEQTVPFGGSLREYERMFSLNAPDRRSNILDCAGGPSSFNAELTTPGGAICSIDPLYQFTGAEIQRQFFQTLDQVIQQIRATPQNWVWSHHRDPDDLRQNRITVMDAFVADYQSGQGTDRYISVSLPSLPFEEDRFDLALSSHFCSCTRITSLNRLTSTPFEPCSESRAKCGSSRCSRSVRNDRNT